MIGFTVAYFLAFHVRTLGWQIALFLLCTIPFWTSNIIRMISWIPFLGRNGIANNTLLELGLIDEPLGGAHRDPARTADAIRKQVIASFDELSLVDPEARLETVVLDYVEALRIPPRLIKMVMSEDLEFASAMHRLMGERRLVAERRIDALLTRSVESRVAEFLLDASSRHGIPDSRGILIGVKFTHQEIASYVGSTRETVTLVLGAFKRGGLITTDHRRVVIRDIAGLRKRV